MKRLEALADALMHYSGYSDPTSEVYQARNPGGLRAYSLRHARTEHGYRVFQSHLDGYQALLYDLQVKCSGKSRARLTTASTLRDLALAYGMPATTASFLSKYLKKALQNEVLNESTTLSYFLEDYDG